MTDTRETTVDEKPFARVRGEAVTEAPRDLYIPPDALEVALESFTGPLDLLLYLIRKQNLDVLDIPIAEVTRQYTSYIEAMLELRIEIAAEYLVMAAMLAEIKSRMLLPRPAMPEGLEEEDPRAELVRRLQQYERYRAAAEALDVMPRLERELHLAEVDGSDLPRQRPVPQVSFFDLMDAFREVLKRADLFKHHRVMREPLSVRERMTRILDRLGAGGSLAFETLFEPQEGRAGLVVSFLAILELLKESLVEAVQLEPFAPIHLRQRVIA